MTDNVYQHQLSFFRQSQIISPKDVSDYKGVEKGIDFSPFLFIKRFNFIKKGYNKGRVKG